MVVLLADAQNNLDILTLSGRNAFATEYDSVIPGKAKETGAFVGINLPVPITKKSIFYNNLSYFYFHVNSETELPDSLADPINLHGFILRTGLVQRLGNGRSLQLLISPRIMTDMKGGGTDNFQLGGLAMYEKKYSDKLTIGYGAMFNQEFFGPYLVPLINLNWLINEKFSISGMLPIYAKIKYKASEKFTLGLSHFGLTTSYGLNDEAYPDDYMERQSIDEALFLNYKISKNFYVEGRFGQSMGRSYEQYASDQKAGLTIPLKTFNDDRVAKNIQFENGLFMDFRLIYSIELPKE
jgi:hypothetical protein